MGDGADVVLVRVGDHQAHQAVTPLGDEDRVGHHHLDLGVRRTAEADAAVDRQILSVGTVQVQIHTNLAGPAQRQEREITADRVHHKLSKSARRWRARKGTQNFIERQSTTWSVALYMPPTFFRQCGGGVARRQQAQAI